MTDNAQTPDEIADEFQEEKTSPEVVRQRLAQKDEGGSPIALVAIADEKRRRTVVELLWSDGWSAVEANGPDELLEICRSVAPHVIFADDVRRPDGSSIAEAVRALKPDAPTRMIAALEHAFPATIGNAIADGFDDFVSDVDNGIEILARATANLRAARTLAEVNRQRRDAALLLELSQALASSLDMQLILHTVSRHIADVLSLERCSIVLLDPNRDDAIMVAASEDRAVRDLRIRLSSYPELKMCVDTAAPVLIEDVAREPMLSGVKSDILDRGVRTMALFPIVFEDNVIGVLFLRSSKPSRHLSEHEVRFAQTVASSCAVAVRNARLFDSFRDQNEHIESMRAQAERQTEALRKYQDFFESAADGIGVIDAEGRIVYVNREGRRLLDRGRDELHHVQFQDLLQPESAGQWTDVVAQVRHGRFKRSFDVYVKASTGERIFSLSAGGVGQGTGLIITSFRDVTETREMEGELRTTTKFLENLIDNSPDAIVAADMDGNVILFNKGAERVYGYRADDVIGRMHVSQLYPPGGSAEVMRKLRDERWGGRGRLTAERREIVTATGQTVPVSMSASIVYEDGDEQATVGVFTDLRDRMAIERQLSEAREELSKAEKARVATELAGMAAHELNQPLTSVLGYAEMLKARVPEADQRLRRPIETIFKQAERMAEIVRKIGRVTRYETKRYGANTDIFDLNRASDDELESPTGGHELPRLNTLSSRPGSLMPNTPSTEVAAPTTTRGSASLPPVPSASLATSSLPAATVPSTPPMPAQTPPPSTFHDVGGSDPAADEATTWPPRPSSSSARDVLAALARRAATHRAPDPGADPRASVVRLETVDDVGYAATQRKLAEQKAADARAAEGEPLDSTRKITPLSRTPTPIPSAASPAPKSISLSALVAPASDDDDHTNPGVRVPDRRRRND